MNGLCPQCRRQIPGGKLSCPYCLLERSKEAMRRYQLSRLLLIAEGKGELVIHRKSGGDHAQTFSPYTRDGRARGFFCGGDLSDFGKDNALILAPEKRRYRAAYRGKGYSNVCQKCREAIEELLVEARTAEEMKNA